MTRGCAVETRIQLSEKTGTSKKRVLLKWELPNCKKGVGLYEKHVHVLKRRMSKWEVVCFTRREVV